MSTTTASIFPRVQRVLTRVMEVPPESITPTSPRTDFAKWDSLNHLTLIMELEAEFAVSFTLDESTTLTSLPAILTLLQQRLNDSTT